jgi:type II secretory pathway pseudopilin PulG
MVPERSLSFSYAPPSRSARRARVRCNNRVAVSQAGFTLLEILTAMALFFMVAGILVSGVAQAIRVAEVGSTESANARDQAMRLAWFRETIGLSVLPPPTSRLDPPPPLVGDARSVEGLSINVPNAKTHGPTRYKFEVVFSADSGESQLRLESRENVPDLLKDGASSGVLASWRGSEGRFFFLDEENNWQERWPAANAGSNRSSKNAPLVSPLPKAIELRYASPAQSVVVAIQDRSIPPPSLAELMK